MESDEESYDEELVGVLPPESKNWRGILISTAVIVVVLSLILIVIVIVTPDDETVHLGDVFTADDIFSPDFQPRSFHARWSPESDVLVYRSKDGEIIEYDVTTNTTSVIMDNSTFRQLNTEWFSVSPDRRYVLVAHDMQMIYRHTFAAYYKIYDRETKSPNSRMTPFPRGSGDWNVEKIQFAGWSPKNNSLTFVFQNNLYYQASPEHTPNWITEDGRYQHVYNGIPDWIYEEEILHSNRAHWWSLSNTYLCYARFDDTSVPRYRFPYYGTGEDVYGGVEEIPYPKAGDIREGTAPNVTLYLVTPNSPAEQKVLQPPVNLGIDHYVMDVSWQNDSHLLITWANRIQNRTVYALCDAHQATCHLNQQESSSGWVDVTPPVFVHQGYLIIHPVQDTPSTGYWKHITLIYTPSGVAGHRTAITQGAWEVEEILAWDKEQNYVYYTSNNGDPKTKHVFRVILEEGSSHLHTPECLTCNTTDQCRHATAMFSGSAKYYILQCHGPGVPSFRLKSTDNSIDIVLEDNLDLHKRLSTKALPTREYVNVDLGDVRLLAQVDLPPSLNKKHDVLYPMLIYVYGGPGSNQVSEKFQIGWPSFLGSSHKVIYVSVDGRGTHGRGQRWLHATYMKLGSVEIQDQIRAAEYLRDNLAYVDKERIAIWGWSYGGFVTLHTLMDSISPVFQCGVAVAPVTDWTYYDTVYTERYMRLEKDNFMGYGNANVSGKVDNLRGKNLLLVHGTADDNVHFQNSAQLIKALTQADIDFHMQIYSDKNHALSGAATSRHLYRTITRFLIDTCWDGAQPRIAKAG